MNGVARLVFLTVTTLRLGPVNGPEAEGGKTPVPDCPLQIQPVETSGSWLDRSPTTRWQGDVSEWHRGVVWYAECHRKTGEYIDYIMSMRNIEPLVKESESPIITYHIFPLSCQAFLRPLAQDGKGMEKGGFKGPSSDPSCHFWGAKNGSKWWKNVGQNPATVVEEGR